MFPRFPPESCRWKWCLLEFNRKVGCICTSSNVRSSTDSLKWDTQKMDYLKDINMTPYLLYLNKTICVLPYVNLVTFNYSRLNVRLSKFSIERLNVFDKLWVFLFFFQRNVFILHFIKLVPILLACVVFLVFIINYSFVYFI